MGGTWHWYPQGLRALTTGTFDLSSDELGIALVTSIYTPSMEHAFRSDLVGEVPDGGGYSSGGVAVTGIGISVDSETGQVRITADDPVWDPASFTCRGSVLYRRRGGSASADELIGYCINDVDQAPEQQPLVVRLSNTRVLTLTPA